MAKAIFVKHKKKRGRPATGHDPLVGVRLPPELIAAIDAWAKRERAVSRSDAIRRFIERALAGSQPRNRSKKAATKARKMAGQELDRVADQSQPVEVRERRERRLTKGPEEFRDMRVDLPKPKG